MGRQNSVPSGKFFSFSPDFEIIFKRGQKAVLGNNARGVDQQEICPFTLEPLKECYSVRHTHNRKICPFSLESCSQALMLS